MFSGLSRIWILPVCVATLGALPPTGALAQAQQGYDSPLYTPQPPAELDRNYGLPTFGMPGSELPRPAVTAPEKPVPAETGFFKDPTEIELPKRRPSKVGSSNMETPLFTTSEDMTTADTTMTTGDTTTGGDTYMTPETIGNPGRAARR